MNRLYAGRPQFFSHPHIIAIAAGLAVLLCLPMLGNGLFLDDYGQRIKLLTGDTTIFQLFGYGEQLIPSGELPWWTHPESHIRFFRPLAAWLTRFDYALWPNALWAMHLHSILWYGALVVVAGWTYRRLMPLPWAAGLAVVLFAIDANHAGAVSWLCNRNVLLSMICGLLALLAHTRQTPGLRILAAGLFALALTAGESALAISGYLLAYELFLVQASLFSRFLRLLPYGLIALAYLLFWHFAGYGTSGPGFYIDPGRDPGLFIHEMIYRMPAYLSSQFLPPPAEFMGLLSTTVIAGWTRALAWTYALTVVILLGWYFWPLLRQVREARFFALGMIIALIPLSGITMVSRVLWYVGFGALGLIALYAAHYRANLPGLRERRYSGFLLAWLLVLHLWLSPFMYVLAGKLPDWLDQQWDTQVVHLPNTRSAAVAATDTTAATGAAGSIEANAAVMATAAPILLLNTESYIVNVMFPLLKDKAYSLGTQPARAEPAIQRIFALTEGSETYTLSRTNDQRLQIHSDAGFSALRPPAYGFKAGEKIIHEGVSVHVLAVNAQGAARTLAFDFPAGELDRFQVLRWQKKHFVPARLPAIGEQLTITSEK